MQVKYEYNKAKIKVSSNTLSKINDEDPWGNSTLFGKWIYQNKITAKIKVNCLNGHTDMIIGIVPENWINTNGIVQSCDSYCYWPNGNVKYSGSQTKTVDEFDTGDVLTLTVNCSSGIFSYTIEGDTGHKSGILFSNINLKNKRYKFGVSFYSSKSSISILSITDDDTELKVLIIHCTLFC